MGKKQKKETTLISVQTFRIQKNKSLDANLNDYIKFLKTKHSHLSSKEYLNLIHRYISKMSKKKGPIPQHIIRKTTLKFKICKKCDKWAISSKKMVECTLCQDHFHLNCAQGYSQDQSDWKCQPCIKICHKKEKLLIELQKANKPPVCQKCTKNKNQISAKCLKCAKYYHKSCYGEPFVVCGDCNKNIETKLKKNRQISLRQSFKRAERNSSLKKPKRESQLINNNCKDKQSQKEIPSQNQSETKTLQKPLKYLNQSTQSSTIISNSKRFIAKFPELSVQEIQKYKQNLMFAILSKNMQYTEELQCHNCSLFEDNEDSIDFALEHLSFSDMKMFKEYKKQPIGPFLLEYKQNCGYDVIADKDLPAGMIICEYVGDVYTHREALSLQQNDSVMELKNGKNADETLLIVPRKYTNIARFINGVNEHDKDRKKKQNVINIKTLAQGRPVVILYTARAIKKGESLLYNYGAGNAAIKYDTSQYI